MSNCLGLLCCCSGLVLEWKYRDCAWWYLGKSSCADPEALIPEDVRDAGLLGHGLFLKMRVEEKGATSLPSNPGGGLFVFMFKEEDETNVSFIFWSESESSIAVSSCVLCCLMSKGERMMQLPFWKQLLITWSMSGRRSRQPSWTRYSTPHVLNSSW